MTKKEQLFRYLAENSFAAPPTVRELCAALSIKSTSTVFNLLHSLEEDGLITIAKGKRRNISLTGHSDVVKIPLVGTVTAGQPILASHNAGEYISCEISNPRGDMFALRVRGDSMNGAGILDGDVIIARQTQMADNGEIVVALIDDEATVKRLFRNGGSVELRAENADYAPITAKDISLLGKVVSVIRHYE